MGQVPQKNETSLRYALIGSGRLADHFSHYFDLIGINYVQWSRNEDPQFNTLSPSKEPDLKRRLEQTIAPASHVLLLIKDDAIEKFVSQYPFLRDKKLVHFSGALSLDGIDSAHPLMTFTQDLYDIETYQNIPFITERGKHSFHQLFPELGNTSYAIDPEQKALYHSLCVASGNFTALLWSHVIEQMNQHMDLPAHILKPYMTQVFINMIKDPVRALTGPLARKDLTTVQKNLKALDGLPLSDIYKAFLPLANINPSALEAVSPPDEDAQKPSPTSVSQYE